MPVPSSDLHLGIIVPSSNTIMEPLITAMLDTINAEVPSVQLTPHFSRFRVTQISLDERAQSQFDLPAMMQAAALLADANVDAIGWGGTSAGWLGLDTDRRLCKEIEAEWAIPATTSTLALVDILHRLGDPDVGLVTPYIPQMNTAIRQTFATVGIRIAEDDQHLSITDNRQIGAVTAQQIGTMVNAVLEKQPELKVVTTFCTNLSAARAVPAWEVTHSARDVRVLDSVSTIVWGLLSQLNISTSGTGVAQHWGRIFEIAPVPAEARI